MPVGRWGLDAYGLSPWGGAATLQVLEVYPLGPRSIYARFNVAPLAASPLSKGDVQNIRSWDLIRLDTGARIEVVGATRRRLPEEWTLHLLTSLGPGAVSHKLDAGRLRTAGGLPATPPSVVTFRGVDVDKPVHGVAALRNKVVDFRNEEFFGNGRALRPESGGASYAVESGVSGYKKRLHRMFTTKKGTHPADPNFGAALELKELLADPLGVQRAAQEQVNRDPETASASVMVTLNDLGVGLVVVKARLKSGESADARVEVDSAGVRVV